MEFELKTYKFSKIEYCFQKSGIIFFYYGNDLNTKNWVRVEQDFAQSDLCYHRMYNTLAIKSLKASIFKNLTSVINGPTLLITRNERKQKTALSAKKLININPLLSLLCLRVNDKIYSVPQFESLIHFNYKKNISALRKSLLIFLRKPYYKLKS